MSESKISWVAVVLSLVSEHANPHSNLHKLDSPSCPVFTCLRTDSGRDSSVWARPVLDYPPLPRP